MVATGAELTWMRYILEAFRVEHLEPTLSHCDNRATIYIATNLVFHKHTKHIKMDCHIVRDPMQEEKIATCHVSTMHQVADIITKALAFDLFRSHLIKMGMVNYHSPSCGGC